MVKACLAFGCDQKFTKDTDVSFYSLPKDKDRQLKWLTALNQKTLDVKPFHVICSKHFKLTDFNIDPSGRQILKPFAVPSVFDKVLNKPKKKITRRKKHKPKSDEKTVTKTYNFRDRKSTGDNNKIKPKVIKSNTSDHTYSTSKPDPSQAKEVSTDHRYSVIEQKTGDIAKTINITDHTYTRLSAGKEPSATIPNAVTPLRHDEHNYSLNSQKKRSGKTDNHESEKPALLLREHTDHAYLGNDIKDLNHSSLIKSLEVPLKLTESTNLNLRDHTYSKSDKKTKKNDKKSPSPAVLTEQVNITTKSIKTKADPVKNPIKISNDYDLHLEERPPLVDCVLLSQVGRERVPPNKFDELKPNLFLLEPVDNDLRNDGGDNKGLRDESDFNLAPIPFTPTYVLINSKLLKPSKAEQRMEQASLLFEEAFGRKPSEDKMETTHFESYENELCCEGVYTDELLRRCALRRRFAQPRYVGDYNVADMSCEKNAKRYYELTKTRMESQKYLIRRLRTQNSRLSNRFKKLSQEILKVKKLIIDKNKKI